MRECKENWTLQVYYAYMVNLNCPFLLNIVNFTQQFVKYNKDVKKSTHLAKRELKHRVTTKRDVFYIRVSSFQKKIKEGGGWESARGQEVEVWNDV